jgi:CRISPR-associated protein Cas2
MSEKPILRVIAYDIASDRRRRRIAATLEERAVRVQDSVFETRLTHRQAERLMASLERLAAKGDSVRLYTVPDAVLPRCREVGGPLMAGAARYWLL